MFLVKTTTNIYDQLKRNYQESVIIKERNIYKQKHKKTCYCQLATKRSMTFVTYVNKNRSITLFCGYNFI